MNTKITFEHAVVVDFDGAFLRSKIERRLATIFCLVYRYLLNCMSNRDLVFKAIPVNWLIRFSLDLNTKNSKVVLPFINNK